MLDYLDIYQIYFIRLKKIQKKKAEIRAEKERIQEELRAQGVAVETGANLLEESYDEDLLFEN